MARSLSIEIYIELLVSPQDERLLDLLDFPKAREQPDKVFTRASFKSKGRTISRVKRPVSALKSLIASNQANEAIVRYKDGTSLRLDANLQVPGLQTVSVEQLLDISPQSPYWSPASTWAVPKTEPAKTALQSAQLEEEGIAKYKIVLPSSLFTYVRLENIVSFALLGQLLARWLPRGLCGRITGGAGLFVSDPETNISFSTTPTFGTVLGRSPSIGAKRASEICLLQPLVVHDYEVCQSLAMKLEATTQQRMEVIDVAGDQSTGILVLGDDYSKPEFKRSIPDYFLGERWVDGERWVRDG